MGVRERITKSVVGQFHHPHGLGGRLAGWVMGHRPSNVQRNVWVVSLLDVQPTDRVLEIGFGPGVAIEELCKRAVDGRVYGLDVSELMVRTSRRRNAAAVASGLADLRQGSVRDLPDLGEPLDKVMAVNSAGFWPEPVDRLRALRGLMRPGGTIALASQPRCPGATSATSAEAAKEIEGLLADAGLTAMRVETLDLEPPVVCVLGVNPG